MRTDDFSRQLEAGARLNSEEFKPSAYYDPDGDCIEFLAAPDSFYAERVDELVTVYYSHITNEVIGSLIKGVKRFIKSHPNAAVMIEDGKIRLSHLLISRISAKETTIDNVAVLRYRKLLKVAEKSGVEADVCEYV